MSVSIPITGISTYQKNSIELPSWLWQELEHYLSAAKEELPPHQEVSVSSIIESILVAQLQSDELFRAWKHDAGITDAWPAASGKRPRRSRGSGPGRPARKRATAKGLPASSDGAKPNRQATSPTPSAEEVSRLFSSGAS